MLRRAILLLAAFCAATPVAAQPAPTETVAFATVGGQPLLLDFFRPPNATAPTPIVVWLHDGGWLTGTRALPAFVAPLLDRGIAIASIDYRLTSETGRYGAESVTFPAQIHDVKAAIRFLRANPARFGIDPGRIGAWGSSAGGHLAALAGTSGNVAELEGDVGGNLGVSSRVQAVVDYYGPTDLLQLAPDVTTPPGTIVQHDPPGGPGSLLIGFSRANEGLGVLRNNRNSAATPFPIFLALAEAANPITHIDATDPPLLALHGTADNQVAIRQSQRLVTALDAAGVDATLVEVPGASHGPFPASENQRAIDFFVQRLSAATIPIGRPEALTGSFFDAATAGQGLEIQWIAGDVLLAIFYGHRDDGSNLFLAGTRVGRPGYGQAIAIPLTVTRNGRFNGLDPSAIRRDPWGTLTITFTSCNAATAQLAGTDGTQNLALARLSGLPPPGCD